MTVPKKIISFISEALNFFIKKSKILWTYERWPVVEVNNFSDVGPNVDLFPLLGGTDGDIDSGWSSLLGEGACGEIV